MSGRVFLPACASHNQLNEGRILETPLRSASVTHEKFSSPLFFPRPWISQPWRNCPRWIGGKKKTIYFCRNLHFPHIYPFRREKQINIHFSTAIVHEFCLCFLIRTTQKWNFFFVLARRRSNSVFFPLCFFFPSPRSRKSVMRILSWMDFFSPLLNPTNLSSSHKVTSYIIVCGGKTVPEHMVILHAHVAQSMFSLCSVYVQPTR